MDVQSTRGSVTIDHRRRIAREGAFLAQLTSFKAGTVRDDFIPHVCPCFTLLGLPVSVSAGRDAGIERFAH
jgi:hypothetical protein